MSDAIREAFEAWYISEYGTLGDGVKFHGKFGYPDIVVDTAWKSWQAALQSQTAPAVPDGGEALAKIIKDAHMEGQKSATGREGTEFRWLHSDAKVTADIFLTAAPSPDHIADAGKVEEEWPVADDIMTAYLQEKAEAAGYHPDDLDARLAHFAGLVIADAAPSVPENEEIKRALVWAMNNMNFHTRAHNFARFVLGRGGNGDFGDCIEFFRAYTRLRTAGDEGEEETHG